MTVEDIIKLVCEFVGEREIYEKLSSDENLSEREQEKVDLMTRCFNLVNQEIASDYLPLLTKEEVDCADNILNLSVLSKNAIQIHGIKNRFGINLRFKAFPTYVEASGVPKTVTYSYFPSELSLSDEVEMPFGLSARVYAYGVASEYLLIDGVSEDAEIWENRYKQSLFMLSQKHGEHILPKRRWR